MVINYSTRLPASQFFIEVITCGGIARENIEVLNEHNIKVCILPDKSSNLWAYYTELVEELRLLEPDIVHVNGSSAAIALELYAAKKAGVQARIGHCHNSRCEHPLLNAMLRYYLPRVITNRLACSSLAGDFIFNSGTYDVLPNAFEIDKFVFDAGNRKRIRKELGIADDELLFGEVGRVNAVKNQGFAMDVVVALRNSGYKARLVIVGDGPLYAEAQAYAHELPFPDAVMFVGDQANTAPYYSACDALLFPTRYEGLGIAVLEAQIAGLPCYVSKAVPKDADIGGVVYRKGIDSCPSEWASWIAENHEKHLTVDRTIMPPDAARYDINRCVGNLVSYYENLASAGRQVGDIRLVIA